MILGITGAMRLRLQLVEYSPAKTHVGRSASIPGVAPRADEKDVNDAAFGLALEYLHRIGARDIAGATNFLGVAIETEGIGAINDALADVCRSLMDRVVFPAGTIDIHAVVDRIALRVVELSGDEQPGALDRVRALIVFLGSEGLPCRARDDVASWSPDDRLHDSVACAIGLVGIVAGVEGATVSETVDAITPPSPVVTPPGTYGLAWRGPGGAEPFAGFVPRGYTAHITFLGETTCSLRAIFARVASLRDASLPGEISVHEQLDTTDGKHDADAQHQQRW
jgi:hypothetical protein